MSDLPPILPPDMPGIPPLPGPGPDLPPIPEEMPGESFPDGLPGDTPPPLIASGFMLR